MLKQCKVCNKVKDMHFRASTCSECISIGYKYCASCGIVKPVTSFNACGLYLQANCKVCDVQARTTRRKANPERDREAVRRYTRTAKGKAKDANLRHARRGAIGVITADKWYNIQEMFDFSCAYCGSSEKLTQDHVLPISKGGSNTVNNLVPACQHCNSSKGAKLMSTWYTSQYFFNLQRYKKILHHIGGTDVCS